MINTRKICKMLHINEHAFIVQYEKDRKNFTPFLMSSYTTRRQVKPEVVDNEEQLLYEAEMLFTEMIEGLTDELKAIRRFRQTFYGKGDDKNKEVSDLS